MQWQEAVVTGTQRTIRQDSEVLLRQIDGRLATLRTAPPSAAGDLDAAERTADALRRLVAATARASAADRARVRAAVHFFVSRGKARSAAWRYGSPMPASRRNERRPDRSLGDDVRVVNEIIQDLGRSERA
jgi:hypothetical protein